MMTLFFILIGTLQQLLGFYVMVRLHDKFAQAAKILDGYSETKITVLIFLWPLTALAILACHYWMQLGARNG